MVSCCYTVSIHTRWDYCDIPICGKLLLYSLNTHAIGLLWYSNLWLVCVIQSQCTCDVIIAIFQSVVSWCYTVSIHMRCDSCDIPLCGKLVINSLNTHAMWFLWYPLMWKVGPLCSGLKFKLFFQSCSKSIKNYWNCLFIDTDINFMCLFVKL